MTIQKNIFWFTGLSGSGKTTLGYALKNYFDDHNIPSLVIDGDELRSGLSSDLGFSDSDRIENSRRAMELSMLLLKNEIIPITTLISPFESERLKIKEHFKDYEFKLIYLDVNIDICKKRDPKGLYRRKIKNFTGIGSNYEIPSKPNLILDTNSLSVESCVTKILDI
jgi:adenylylsulfate kinase